MPRWCPATQKSPLAAERVMHGRLMGHLVISETKEKTGHQEGMICRFRLGEGRVIHSPRWKTVELTPPAIPQGAQN